MKHINVIDRHTEDHAHQTENKTGYQHNKKQVNNRYTWMVISTIIRVCIQNFVLLQNKFGLNIDNVC